MIRASLAIVVLLASAALPDGARATDGYKISYTVRKGDSLGRIAKRHKTTIRKIRRWNRLRSTRIRVGQKLTLYSLTPKRPTRIISHKIRRGDSLRKIAKQYKTTVRRIRQLNRIRGRRIIAGRRLKIEVPGPENPSKSTGRPQHGRLENGEKLGPGPGYKILRPGRVWGTNSTITHLMVQIPKVKRKWRRAPDVIVGDISRKKGGSFPPHRSHQNGRDVDIGYYHKVGRNKPHPKTFRKATPKNLDVAKTWYLLEAFLDTGEVDYIFIDRSLHKTLRTYALRKGKRRKHKKRWLQKVFGKSTAVGLIRHSPSHKNHFHIRFTQGKPTAPPKKKGRKRGR